MAFTDRLINSNNKVIEIRKGQSPLYSTLNITFSYNKPLSLGVRYVITGTDMTSEDNTIVDWHEVFLDIQPESPLEQTTVSQHIELPFVRFDKGRDYIFKYYYVFGDMDSGGLSPASTITESVSLNDNIIYQNNPLFTTGGVQNQFTYTNAQELPNKISIDLSFSIV